MIGNRIRGEPPLEALIRVRLSDGTFIAHNDLSRNHPELLDVLLHATTRNGQVIERNDNVVDEGENNEVN